MAVTLRWLIENSSLKNLRCVACPEKLAVAITSVNILDNPDVIKWIKENELILTSGYLIMNDEALQIKLIHDLHQVGCAALGIKVRRYFQSIPDSMIQEAERLGLPIIELPFFYSFSDISKVVYGRLYAQDTLHIRQEQRTIANLSNLFFGGKHLDEMLNFLSYQYHTTVFLVDSAGTVLEHSQTSQIGLEFPKHIPALSNPISVTTVSIPISGRTVEVLLVPLQGNLGGLCLIGTNNAALQKDINVLQRISVILSLKLEQRRFEWLSMYQQENGFMEFLMTGIEHLSEQEIIHMCDQYHFDYQCKRICISLFSLTEKGYTIPESLSDQIEAITADYCNKQSKNHIQSFICRSQKQLCIFLLCNPFVSNPELSSLAKALIDRFSTLLGGKEYSAIRFGISRCHQSIHTIHQSTRECIQTFELMREILPEARAYFYTDNTVYHLLNSMPADELRHIYLDTIAVLAQFDKDNNSDLLHTLTVFFQCRFNAMQAAKELFIHRNTLLNRLEKVRMVLHCDMQSMDDIMAIYLGICIFNMLN